MKANVGVNQLARRRSPHLRCSTERTTFAQVRGPHVVQKKLAAVFPRAAPPAWPVLTMKITFLPGVDKQL
jgi:hypothetical protein